MQCEFSITCPNCHGSPPLIIKFVNSVKYAAPKILSRCNCSQNDILTKSIDELFVKNVVQTNLYLDNARWDNAFANAQFLHKDYLVDFLETQINSLNIVYSKINIKLKRIQKYFNALKKNVDKLYAWNLKFKKDLVNFGYKLYEDFYMAKGTTFFNCMSNFQNFRLDKDDKIIEYFLKILPELDNLDKLISSINNLDKNLHDATKTYVIKNSPVIADDSLFDSALGRESKAYRIPNVGKTLKYSTNIANKTFKKIVRIPNAHEGSIEACCQLDNGDIATCGYDTIIKLWKKFEHKPYAGLFGHTSPVLSIIQLNNKYLATASADRTIQILDVNKITIVKTLAEHTDRVLKLVKLSNNKFVSCSADTTLRVWDPLQDHSSFCLKGHTNTVVNCVEIDNGVIASCSLDEHVRIWDIYKKKCVKKYKMKQALVDIDVHPANKELMILTTERKVIFVNMVECTITKEYVNKIPTYTMGHLNNGNIILGCSEGKIIIIDYDKLNVVCTLKAHTNAINCIRVLQNQALCSTSWDGSFSYEL